MAAPRGAPVCKNTFTDICLILSGSNVSSRSCCSICASRSLSFPVSRIICFSCRSFSCISQAPKSPRPDRFPHQKDGRRIHFQIRSAPRGWCAPGVDTGGRTLPAGCYQYRWQTNCDLTPGRGGYKADRTTPVHHKNEHFPAHENGLPDV